MEPPPNRKLADGFTLIELLVVISIIAILAAMLLPALSAAKQRALVIQCVSNNKQIAAAFKVYMGDNQNKFPLDNGQPGDAWYNYAANGDLEFGYGGGDQTVAYSAMGVTTPPAAKRVVNPYLSNYEVCHCPADQGETLPFPGGNWKPSNFNAMGSSYRYNYTTENWANPTRYPQAALPSPYSLAGRDESWCPSPSTYILLHEPPACCWNFTGGLYFLWHFAKGPTTIASPTVASSKFVAVIAFVDGHSAWFDFTTQLKQSYKTEATGDWLWYKPK